MRHHSRATQTTVLMAAAGVLLLLASGRTNPQNAPVGERASQHREILYELQAPESHAFRIPHDYTERREGTKYYFNIVRDGSHVTDPESIDLDSGGTLKHEVLSGKQVK